MDRDRDRLGTAMMVVAVSCAVIVTALLVRQQLFPPPRIAAGLTSRTVSDWHLYASGGHRIGPPDAAVTITEFGDFQCPFCAQFEAHALRAVAARYPTQVATVFRNWPLPMHPMAYAAARAAECADAEGKFQPFRDSLFAHQDSLGTVLFMRVGAEVGIVRRAEFEACVTATAPVEMVERDIAAARRLGAHGTPTVLVNGKLLNAPPDSAQLDSLVQLALARGRKDH